jgi:regulator of sigma E protease
MEVFIKIVQLLLSLSILVLLHEFGHYIAARIFKIRVEKFYLFFNPWFSIFKIKRGDTTYGIGWLPLGGYVKIAGMIDESMDKTQLKKPPQPWEFRSKPAWQRLIVMVAGVFLNLILAFVIYILLLFVFGEKYLPVSSVKYGYAADSLAYEIGFRDGDKIIMLDGKYAENAHTIPFDIILNKTKVITVERENEQIDINVSPGIINTLIQNKNFNFLSVRFPTIIHSFPKNSFASEAGLQEEDTIIAVNNYPTLFFHEFKKQLVANADTAVFITVLRGSDTLMFETTVGADATIGIFPYNEYTLFDLTTKTYSLISAIPAGIKFTWQQTTGYLKQLRIIFSPQTKAYESLGGFITIGNLFPGSWDWYSFWAMTAFISIILAIMNLLPIPALDGGHVMFLLWELITRRKPHEKFMEYAQIAGMVFLLLLVLYANGNDILRLFK